jgi:alcohol dehydrogenase
MLPHVVRFNNDPRYAELAPDLPALLAGLLAKAGIAPRLRDHGVTDVKPLAAEAARQWTAQFNPRHVEAADFEGLYRSAFEVRGPGSLGSTDETAGGRGA